MQMNSNTPQLHKLQLSMIESVMTRDFMIWKCIAVFFLPAHGYVDRIFFFKVKIKLKCHMANFTMSLISPIQIVATPTSGERVEIRPSARS
jgi:hypothetical protein